MYISNAQILFVVLGQKNRSKMEEAGVKFENETKKTVMAAVKSINVVKLVKNIPPLKKLHHFFSLSKVSTLHDHYTLAE